MSNDLTVYRLETIARLVREVLDDPNAGLDESHAVMIEKLVKHYSYFQQRMYPISEHPQCQYGEEKPMFAMLQPVRQAGMYVDVGASHPMECSNTWPFYQYGWRGLLIEPLPTCWSSLLYQRPGDFLWPSAVSDCKTMAILQEASTLSSLRADWPTAGRNELLVETNTLSAILEKFPEIRDACRLCSIDVEGYEQQVIRGIDFETFHPEMFIVEYRTFGPGGTGEDVAWQWLPLMKKGGYVPIDRNELNMILLRKDKMTEWEEIADAARMCNPKELEQYESL